MNVSPLAGKPAESSLLVNIPRLITAYYAGHPDPTASDQRVAFGTSGHRGSAFKNAFNEAHILAISQGICEFRRQRDIDGPLFLGMDTHALSEPAFASALEVLAANGVEVMVDQLRETLAAARVDPPHLLVGHSFSSLTVQPFACLHPDEVFGMVLVDGAHEESGRSWWIMCPAPSATSTRPEFDRAASSPETASGPPRRQD